MIQIKSKQESLSFIKEHHLNHFGETIFQKGETDQVNQFLIENDFPYYFLRELVPGTKNVFYDLSKEEVLNYSSKFERFGLDVSSKNFMTHQKLCAEVFLGKDGTFLYSGSTNPESTHRNFLKPNFFLNTDLSDPRIKYLPYMEEIFTYLEKNQLYDLIIELCYFDIPVGINQENIVVYEVRTDY